MLTPDTYLMLARADDLLNDVVDSAYAGAASEDVPTLDSMRRRLSFELAESSQKAQGVPGQMTMRAAFKDKSPETAKKVLDIWCARFTARNLQLFADRTGANSEFLGKSLDSVRKDFEKAEDRLLEYRKANQTGLLKIRLASVESAYSTLLEQYNAKLRALPPLEAAQKTTAQLLAKEPETKVLSRGMSREALWNLAAQSAAGNAAKNPDEFSVRDEIPNELHKSLKARSADAGIEIASLRASIKDLRERLDKSEREYTALNARILAAETEAARLQRERDTLQESYNTLSKQYQNAQVAATEAATPIKIVGQPIVPREPVSRGGLKILCLAGLLGIFIGTTAALVAEMFAKRTEAKA